MDAIDLIDRIDVGVVHPVHNVHAVHSVSMPGLRSVHFLLPRTVHPTQPGDTNALDDVHLKKEKTQEHTTTLFLRERLFMVEPRRIELLTS